MFPFQSTAPASFTLDTNGNISNLNNIIVRKAHAGKVEITTNLNTYNIRSNPITEDAGCKINFTPIFSETQAPANSTTPVFVGANISITSPISCQPGKYNNTFFISLGTFASGRISFSYTISEPQTLTLIETESLDFGTILSQRSSAQLTIDPANGIFSGNAHQLSAGHRGKFKIIGTPDTPYTISAINETLLESPVSKSHLTAKLTTSSSGVIQSNQEDDIYVGGTLYISATASPGEYSGVYTLTVNY